jgi:curli biogenesis system outer membrane secretion channel CsgG
LSDLTLRKKEVPMKIMKDFSGWLTIIMAFVIYGCVTTGQPTAEVTHTQGPSMAEAQMERYDGPKARIAIGDFQVKASDATIEIGDGLREMLVTGLFNCNRFIVLERQAVQDVLLEQDLGASGRVKRQTAAPIGELEGAEILIYGVVTEFEVDASGTGINLGMFKLPLALGAGRTKAHLAIDIRTVDTGTGRILNAYRVEGKASDFNANIGTEIGGGDTEMPVALGVYSNTPMEKAIRVAIDKAVEYLSSKTPAKYFHYK